MDPISPHVPRLRVFNPSDSGASPLTPIMPSPSAGALRLEVAADPPGAGVAARARAVRALRRVLRALMADARRGIPAPRECQPCQSTCCGRGRGKRANHESVARGSRWTDVAIGMPCASQTTPGRVIFFVFLTTYERHPRGSPPEKPSNDDAPTMPRPMRPGVGRERGWKGEHARTSNCTTRHHLANGNDGAQIFPFSCATVLKYLGAPDCQVQFCHFTTLLPPCGHVAARTRACEAGHAVMFPQLHSSKQVVQHLRALLGSKFPVEQLC